MRGKGLWLSIKPIFAPTDVAASVALIVLVSVFTMVYFGARHSVTSHSVTTQASPVAVDATPTPHISVSPFAPRDPVANPTTDTGLTTVIRAAVATTHKYATVPPRPAGSPTPASTAPTASPSPSTTVSATATPTASPAATPTPTAAPTPPPTPTATAVVSPSPLPSPS
jgi:hypothetical protein